MELVSRELSQARIMKNVTILSVSVLLLFTAYDGLFMLQSTMNRKDGIGVATGAVGYAVWCVSAFLFPKYIIQKLGSKTTICISMCTVILFIASNFYPEWSLMIPVSVLVGVGAPLLWGAQATYLNDIAEMYAKHLVGLNSNNESKKPEIEKSSLHESISNGKNKIFAKKNYQTFTSNEYKNSVMEADSLCQSNPYNSGYHKKKTEDSKSVDSISIASEENPNKPQIHDQEVHHRNIKIDTEDVKAERTLIESTTALFFGIHGMSYLSTHLWGNLITYFLLKRDRDSERNASLVCLCGADYCNVASACFEHNIEQPSDDVRNTLTIVCVCLGIVSFLLMIVFLDPLRKDSSNVRFSLKELLATYRIAIKKEILLLIPSSIFLGMAQGFYAGDFNKAFVGCAWGAYNVGLVAICYGVFSGLASYFSGWSVRKVGRIPIFSFAASMEVGVIVILLVWKPTFEHISLFFVSSAMLGIYVGVYWSQLRAFHGILFKNDEEAVFAAFHVWYSLGYMISFAYSNFLCTSVKLYVLLAICSVGFIGYITVERMYSKRKIEIVL